MISQDRAFDPERPLLGICLLDPSGFRRASHLAPSDFADPRNALIFEFGQARALRGERVGVTELVTDLDQVGRLADAGGRDYLLGLVADPLASDPRGLDALLPAVRGRAQKRRVAAIFESGRRAALDPATSVTDAIGSTRAAIASIEQDTEDETLPLLGAHEPQMLLGLEGDVDPGVPTGYASLDEALGGGIKATEFVVLSGATGSGKTSLATLIALRVAEWATDAPGRGDVLYFSYEMSWEELYVRWVIQSEPAVRDGFHPPAGWSDQDRDLARHAIERLASLPLRVGDRPPTSIESVRAEVERHTLLHGAPALVVVDHLGFMHAHGFTGNNRTAEVTQISHGLKDMARDLRIPVLAVSQLNRASGTRDDHRPRLSDLRDSGSLEQDANAVLFVYRPSYYEDTDDDETRREREAIGVDVELILAKNRRGPTTSLHYTWIGPRYTFLEPVRAVQPGDEWRNPMTQRGVGVTQRYHSSDSITPFDVGSEDTDDDLLSLFQS